MLQNLYNYVIIITCDYNQCKGYMEVYYTILAMLIVFGIFGNKNSGIGEREKPKIKNLQ